MSRRESLFMAGTGPRWAMCDPKTHFGPNFCTFFVSGIFVPKKFRFFAVFRKVTLTPISTDKARYQTGINSEIYLCFACCRCFLCEGVRPLSCTSAHGPRQCFRQIKLIVSVFDGFHVYGSLTGSGLWCA